MVEVEDAAVNGYFLGGPGFYVAEAQVAYEGKFRMDLGGREDVHQVYLVPRRLQSRQPIGPAAFHQAIAPMLLAGLAALLAGRGKHSYDTPDSKVTIPRHELAALALTLGILCFAVVTSVLLVRTRRRLSAAEAAARDGILAAKAEVDRANTLIRSEPQVLAVWNASGEDADIIGDPTIVASAGAPHRVLAFGHWLPPDAAREMECAVEALRARGMGFAMNLTTVAGRPIEADGRVVGGCAILRLRSELGGQL